MHRVFLTMLFHQQSITLTRREMVCFSTCMGRKNYHTDGLIIGFSRAFVGSVDDMCILMARPRQGEVLDLGEAFVPGRIFRQASRYSACTIKNLGLPFLEWSATGTQGGTILQHMLLPDYSKDPFAWPDLIRAFLPIGEKIATVDLSAKVLDVAMKLRHAGVEKIRAYRCEEPARTYLAGSSESAEWSGMFLD